MKTKTIKIQTKEGVHLRVASAVSQKALTLDSRVTIAREGVIADARSLLEIAMLGAGQNSELEVAASGGQEDAAVEEISLLLMDGAGI